MTWRLVACLVAMGTLLTGCADGDEYPARPPEVPISDLTPEIMYSRTTIPRFELTLSDAAIAALGEAPKEYVRGSFRFQGTVLSDVGVRLKGNFTLKTLAEKPSLKIKFNRFVAGRRFLGLEGLTLNNLHSDPSMLREHVAYTVFRAAGVPASRSGFAEVVINGEPYGLYLNLEPIGDDFLADRFDDPTANLYEANNSADLNLNLDGFEQDEGEDTSKADLEALVVLALEKGDGLYFGADSPLDTDEALRFLAAEALTGHFDGYQTRHNYHLLHLLTPDRWLYIPWSLDQAFVRRPGPWDGRGYLLRKCVDDTPTCRVEYVRAALEVLDAADAIDLPALVDEASAFISAAAHADTRKRHSNGSLESGWKGLKNYVSTRSGELREGLSCLDDSQNEPDADQDGYGACWVDCNDQDPAINKGATEVCDAIDNNCSGYADDVPECPCPSETIEGTEYFFCDFDRAWTASRDFCKAQGHVLATLHTATQNQAVFDKAHSIRGGWWAIGLNDRKDEGVHLWRDGTAPNFDKWSDGEPSNLLPQYDCVFYTGNTAATWLERNCNEKRPFICSAQGAE
ncbi:MAG: hypothetical protein ACI9WU_004975 [Myxococcota bacterium]|jgi:hypothetical protein